MEALQTKQAWDQLPQETDTAYHRFSIYLEMGPERTLEKTRVELGKSSGYYRQLETWSSKYDWVRRASKYDSYIIRKSLEGKEKIIDEVTAKLLRAASKMADELIQIAMHDGVISLDEGETQIFNQKLKAIESILDRVGVTKKKDMPELGVVNQAQNLYQQINQTIIKKTEDEEG